MVSMWCLSGNVRENGLERLTEDRKDKTPGVRKKLDGMIDDGEVEDKDQGKQHGASGTRLEGSMSDDDQPGLKLNTPISQSNRVLGSGRLGSSELLYDPACCDYPDTPTASRMKSQSSAASMMREQSSAASMMKGQTPATSMRNSQSPAISLMKCQSPTVSLTESQLALKVATREAYQVNHVNFDGSSNTVSVTMSSTAVICGCV